MSRRQHRIDRAQAFSAFLTDRLLRVPRTEPIPAAEGPGVLRVASYNVHKCVGVDGRFDPGRIGQVIREIAPDVIALQEADKRFGARHGLLDLARLKEETGLMPVPVESANAAAHGWHGNVVLFRQGLVRDVHQVSLPGLEPRGALVVDIDLESGAALGTLSITPAAVGAPVTVALPQHGVAFVVAE